MTYSPWRALEAMPTVIVGWRSDLPSGDAWWCAESQVILLRVGLSHVRARVALAHEIEHVLANDEACQGTAFDQWFEARQERRADQRAARKLVDLDKLADALGWAWHTGEIADELHVDEETVCTRIETLTAAEKGYIERRIAAREGAA